MKFTPLVKNTQTNVKFSETCEVDIYKENVLAPREEALRAKKEAEFYKFNSNWKGKGFRLRVNIKH